MTASTKDSLVGIVAECANKYPHHVAVVFDDGTTKSCITYRELKSQSDKISDVLRRHKAEDTIIGICLDPSVHLPSIIIGILKTQSIFFPFTTDGKEFISKTLSRLKVSWILTLSEQLIEIEGIIRSRKIKIIHPVEFEEFNLVLVALDNDIVNPCVKSLDLAYIITTSGSTALPKLVSVPNRSIVPNILTLREKYKVSEKDVVLMASPPTFDPSIVDIFITLSSGACLLIVPEKVKRMPHLFITITTQRNHITILQATPSLLYQFNPDDLKTSLFCEKSQLRVLAIGGEDFPPISILKRWICKPCNIQIYNLYGITEVSCWSNCYHVSEEDLELDLPNVPIGDALVETQVKVTDHLGNTINEGEGVLWVGSESRVCFINEELNEEKMRKNGEMVWRNTGDIVKILRNRQVIYLCRQDSQIKHHGKRINLDNIDKVVSKISNIKQCVTVYDEEKIYLFISLCILTHGEEDTLRKCVSHFLSSLLPSYYQPNRILFLKYFPVTKHGKIDKKALIKYFKSNPQKHGEIPSRSCELTQWLKQKWHNILYSAPVNSERNDEEIDDHSNFILLGGTSLKAVQLVSELEVYLSSSHPHILDLLLNKTFKHVHDYVLDNINQSNCGDKSLYNILNIKNDSKEIQGLATPNVDIENNHFTNGTEGLNVDSEVNNMPNNAITNIESANQISFETEISQHSEIMMESQCATNNPETCCTTEEETGVQTDLTKDYTINHVECGNNSVAKRKLDNIYDEAEAKLSKYDTCQCFIGFVTRGSQYFKCILNSGQLANPINEYMSFNYFNDQNSDTVDCYSNLSETFSKCVDYKKVYMTSVNSSVINEIVDKDKTNRMVIPLENHNVQNNLHNAKIKTQQCEQHGRYSPEEVFKLKIFWKHNTGKCVDSSPVFGIRSDGETVVLIGSHSHKFSALEVETGHVLWDLTLPDRIESSPVFSKCGQFIAVGCYDGCLYVMNALTGSIEWPFQTGDSIKCSPVLDMVTGLILFGSHDGNIYAVDLTMKKCRWKVNLASGSVFSSPSIRENRVYVATLGGILCCLNIESGEVLWRYQLEKPVFGSLACFTDCLLVPSVDGVIYGISFHGEKVWSFQTEGPIFSSPTICHIPNHGECVLIGSHDNHLYCLNSQGLLVWSYNASHPIYSTSFVFDYKNNLEKPVNETSKETCYHVSNVAEKYDCLTLKGNDRSTTRLSHTIERCYRFEPCYLKGIDSIYLNSKQKLDNKPEGDLEKTKISKGHLNADTKSVYKQNYLAMASTIGELSIIDLHVGKVKASYKLKGEIFSSPIIVGNKLLIGCRDDYLYCFQFE